MEGTSCGYFLNHRFSRRAGDPIAAACYSSGFGSGYQGRINKGQFSFSVDKDNLDGRLSAGEIVSVVEVGETGDLDLASPLSVIGDSAANVDIGGPLTGARLKRMSGRRAFWLSVAISFPGTGIHNP
jgi:hypothetical protein